MKMVNRVISMPAVLDELLGKESNASALVVRVILQYYANRAKAKREKKQQGAELGEILADAPAPELEHIAEVKP